MSVQIESHDRDFSVTVSGSRSQGLRSKAHIPKVFVVSLHRCATQSINLFLQNAGFRGGHYLDYVDGIDYETQTIGFESEPGQVAEILRPAVEKFDALSDVPIPGIYKELDAGFPGAKFIAVYRNPFDWVRSVRHHCKGRPLTPYERVQYWRYLGDRPTYLDEVSDERLLAMYLRHNQELLHHFIGRPDLLLVDLTDSEIGNKIAAFLDVVPGEFPDIDYKRQEASDFRSVLAEREAAITAKDQEIVAAHAAIRSVLNLTHKVLSLPARWKSEDVACTDLARWMSRRRVLLGMLRRPMSERVRIVQAYTASGPIARLAADDILAPMLQPRTLFGLLRRSKRSAEAIVERWLDRSMQQVQVGTFEFLQQGLNRLSAYESRLPIGPAIVDDVSRNNGGEGVGAPLEREALELQHSSLVSAGRFVEEINELRDSIDDDWYGVGFPHSRVNSARMEEQRENVILVVHEASRTGAPVLGWNIAHHLGKRYNMFTLMLDGGPLVTDFVAVSAEVYGPSDRGQREAAACENMLTKLLEQRQFKFAIVNSVECRETIEKFYRRRVPTVLLVHEFECLYPPGALRSAFSLATEIVFPAPLVYQSALAGYPELADRTTRIVPQGVSLTPGAATGPPAVLPSALAQLATARQQGDLVVLGAGSVQFRKGVDLFVATAMATRREAGGRHVHFLWVGHGYMPDQDRNFSVYLHEQIERSNLRDAVVFVEAVPDLEPIYALADIFLLSSRLDPLPNVSIDAAHRGIPIVCFNGASGTADVLLSDPETAGGVVDHLDPAAAARVILLLANDSEARERVGAATRKLAKVTFDMENYVATLDGLGTDAAASVPLG